LYIDSHGKAENARRKAAKDMENAALDTNETISSAEEKNRGVNDGSNE
jgi:hypothetical protein